MKSIYPRSQSIYDKVPLHAAAMGGLDSGRLEDQRTGM